jgi:catalase (peroxidase I)
MHASVSGFEGAWTSDPTKISNEYFKGLLNEEWEAYIVPKTQLSQFKAKGKEIYMLPYDLLFRTDAELQAIAQEYAEDNQAFLADFAAAWTKLMNSDRFEGPAKNLCDAPAVVGPEVAPL